MRTADTGEGEDLDDQVSLGAGIVERPVVEADAFVGIDPHDDLGEVGAGAKCEGGFDDLLGEGEALRGIDRRLQEITGPHAQVRAGHEELGVRHPRA